ncbi:MAG: glucan endo-1,6-beta-glucosidase [Cyclobacteriaceae bacterium]|nr:glucan endo-1,6-beta-glucosidase [Cyclobacteriaceae bacterium]
MKRVWNGATGLFLSGALLFSLAGCKKDEPFNPGPPKTPEEIGKASVYLTTGDKNKLFSAEPEISVVETTSAAVTSLITIDAGQKFQQIDGFGAALTGSSAYLINKKMSSVQRDALLNELFNPETGIGVSYLRMTIGASDFSLSDFTYNDMPTGQQDLTLASFTIDADREDVIPVFKRILNIAPGIKIMGSPWSASAWMKTNGSLKGGELRTEVYNVYANYFVKYIKAYAAEGITIHAVTPQNEPLHFTANYPCMSMPASAQLDFVKNHLGPVFESENINTEIILYDHNWDNTAYAISVLNDANAKKYVAGTAFHAYGGSVSAMSTVRNAHPDKGLYFTEISGGGWATNFGDNLMWNMENIFIGTTNNWSRNVLLWNLALDQNDGPTNNGCSNCRGVVTINNNTGSVTKNEEYYSIAHFSKFVRPGASRVSSQATGVSQFHHVAFINTDGTKVLVVANSSTSSRTFTVREGGNQYSYDIPAKAVATIAW